MDLRLYLALPVTSILLYPTFVMRYLSSDYNADLANAAQPATLRSIAGTSHVFITNTITNTKWIELKRIAIWKWGLSEIESGCEPNYTISTGSKSAVDTKTSGSCCSCITHKHNYDRFNFSVMASAI